MIIYKIEGVFAADKVIKMYMPANKSIYCIDPGIFRLYLTETQNVICVY